MQKSKYPLNQHMTPERQKSMQRFTDYAGEINDRCLYSLSAISCTSLTRLNVLITTAISLLLRSEEPQLEHFLIVIYHDKKVSFLIAKKLTTYTINILYDASNYATMNTHAAQLAMLNDQVIIPSYVINK